jgi:integrase
VLGPYEERGGSEYRLIIVNLGGERTTRTCTSKKEAERWKLTLMSQMQATQERSVKTAIEAYRSYLQDEKGNRSSSIDATVWRLEKFFPDGNAQVVGLTADRCAKLYELLRTTVSKRTGRVLSTDSHRNILAEVKTFLGWCISKGWLKGENPLATVKGKGKRRHGKSQLRIDEARRWIETAQKLADKGDEGAVAAMMTLEMGMRASEITERVVRDLDNDGRLLWIPNSKTEAGKRTVEVPVMLQPLLKKLVEGKPASALIFGEHTREWPRSCVRRICRMAGVPVVCAHSMRGLHGTLAVQAGVTSHIVAASLGHESITTTLQSYAKPEAATSAQQRRVLSVLQGGLGEKNDQAA